MNLKLIGMLAAMAAVGVMACSETTTGDDGVDTDTASDTDTGTGTEPDTDTETMTMTETMELTGVCADNFCNVMPADAACFACIQDVGGPGGACEDEYADCVADMSGCVAFFMGSGGSIDDPEVQALGDCVCTPGNCVD